jgi:malonyl CoA-acyl carrier protein transacylase
MTGKNQKQWLGIITELLESIDLTQAFKTKGKLRRWSAKRTIGGIIATTACVDITTHGISWPAVCLCGIAVLPLIASMFEREHVS